MVSFGYYPGMFKSRLREIYCRFLGLPFPERRLEHLIMLKMIPFKAGDKVLDVGCGEGYFIPTIAMKGCEIIGLDLSLKELKEAHKRIVRLRITNQGFVLKGDAECLGFRNEVFDTVICNCTLEHIREDEKALKEMARVLKTGGYLFLSVPVNEMKDNLLDILFRLPKKLRKILCTSLVNDAKDPQEVIANFLKSAAHARIGYNRENLILALKRLGIETLRYFYYIKRSSILFQIKYYTKLGKDPLLAFLFPILYGLSLLDFYIFPNQQGRAFAIAGKKMSMTAMEI